MALTEKQKMLSGALYHAGDAEIQADAAAARDWMARYNAAFADHAARGALLRERLAAVGLGGGALTIEEEG